MRFIIQKWNEKEHWYECHKVCRTYQEAKQEEQALKKNKERTYIAIKQNLRAVGIKTAQSY